MTTDVTPEMNPRVKRIIVRSALVVALILVILSLVLAFSKRTIASGEKVDRLTGARYGYSLEQYRWRNRVKLTIEHSAGMKLVYELPALTVERVNEERWVANDRAIFLNLNLTSHGSNPARGDARILYDFQKGTLYLTSGLTLWRTWSQSEPLDKNWMSESEFQSVLEKIQ